MELAIGPEEGISYLTDKGCNVSAAAAVCAHDTRPPLGLVVGKEQSSQGNGSYLGPLRVEQGTLEVLWHMTTYRLSRGEASKGTATEPERGQEMPASTCLRPRCCRPEAGAGRVGAACGHPCEGRTALQTDTPVPGSRAVKMLCSEGTLSLSLSEPEFQLSPSGMTCAEWGTWRERLIPVIS